MNITLTGYNPAHKIKAIKAIRAVTGLGLKEAKEVTDTLIPVGDFVSGEGFVRETGEPVTVEVRLPYYIDNEAEGARWAHEQLDELQVYYEPITVTRAQSVRATIKRRIRLVRVRVSNLRVFPLLFTSIPFYVTRPNANGIIGTWSIAAIWGAVITSLVIFNVIGWSAFGVYELVSKVV